ncbi:MAG: transposase [Thermodesulfovibrionales bacterium]
MARPPRIQFPNAFYHIIVRGNRQQALFLDDTDRLAYMDLLNRYKKKCSFILYAYVLMSNHVHLLVETPESPISKIMQMLNFTYTQYFNRKYGKVGHLFQGRYKSLLCDRDQYLLNLVRYIHLNPVRAKIVKEPHFYKWSSHGEYIGKNGGLVDVDRVLRLFSENKAAAKRLYGNFVNEALREGKDMSYYKGVDQQILGDEQFIETVEKAVERTGELRKPSIELLFKEVEKLTGVNREQMIVRNRNARACFARGLLIGAWRESGGKIAQLKTILKRDISTLSKSSRAIDSSEGRESMKRLCSLIQA